MKVLVIGAGGKTGRLVVERALAAGHSVVALVHSKEDGDKHPLPPGAEVIHGDVRNPSRLETAMTGCQGVIDAIGGHTPWAETTLERDAARVVLQVMDSVGAKRLVVVSVLGAGESADQSGWLYEHLVMPTFLHGAMQDKNAMEEEVRQSMVEWVLVRPPVLTDGEATGKVRVVPEGEKAHKLTRADLAGFLVEQLTSPLYEGQAVVIENY